MCSATNRTLISVFFALSILSCGNKEKDSAVELYTKSEIALQNHELNEALGYLDTLNARYPKEVTVRRDAMRLRARIIENMAMDSIGDADAALAEATIHLDEWRPKFRHVESSVGLEGYFLPNGVDEKMMTQNGIQGRVSDKGFFYVVANVQGKAIGLNSFELISGSDAVSSAEISAARVIKVEGSESASFNPEDIEAVGPWLDGHGTPSTLVLRGTKGNVKVKLTKTQGEELKDCYYFSQALQAQRRASIRREKFERMLATARDQLANMPVPESDK